MTKEKIEKEAAAFHAKIDAEWHAIISQPGIQLHEAGRQYEAFLRECGLAEEKREKRTQRWGQALGGIFVLGLNAAFLGFLGFSLQPASALSYGIFFFHAAGLIFCIVVAVLNRPLRDSAANRNTQADAPLTPAPVMRGRSAEAFDMVRRAAHVNEFWRRGGAGERVPFEFVSDGDETPLK